MENSAHALARQMISSRKQFFRHRRSEAIQRQFLTNEGRMLDMIEHSIVQRILASLTVHIEPLGPLGPLPPPPAAVPNIQQINESFLAPTHIDGQCSICHENLSMRECIQLRNCRHTYHRTCATVWYSTSCLCPLCRNDIRTNN
jgi:hypothetical protein